MSGASPAERYNNSDEKRYNIVKKNSYKDLNEIKDYISDIDMMNSPRSNISINSPRENLVNSFENDNDNDPDPQEEQRINEYSDILTKMLKNINKDKYKCDI